MQRKFGFALALLGAVAMPTALTPALAQSAKSVTSQYKHPHSKITLPATAAGLSLTKAQDLYADSLDTATEYSNENYDTVISVYIFRKTNGDVPLWFDRADSVMKMNDRWGNLSSTSAAQSFRPPRQKTASAMRIMYDASGSPQNFKSTGLALLLVNDWYVKVRASSKTLGAAALDMLVDRALADIRWPSNIASAPAAVAIGPCANKLTFAQNAKPATHSKEQRMRSALLGSLTESVIADQIKKGKSEPGAWCRDESSSPLLGVYRNGPSLKHYMLGLADSGRAISHGEDQMGALLRKNNNEEARPEFNVTLHVPDRRINFAPLDGLSPPDQLYNYIEKATAISSMGTWGKDDKKLNISP